MSNEELNVPARFIYKDTGGTTTITTTNAVFLGAVITAGATLPGILTLTDNDANVISQIRATKVGRSYYFIPGVMASVSNGLLLGISSIADGATGSVFYRVIGEEA